jgi:hypothetical protein
MATIHWLPGPKLNSPTVVAAFTGWNDAGDAASMALKHLIAVTGAVKVAAVDPDDFFDFQASRPMARMTESGSRVIIWPTIEIFAAPSPSGDLLFITGPEPQLRWPSFARALIGVGHEVEAALLITLGALLADVAHSRPTNVMASSSDAELIKRHDLSRSRYEGPTGIIGVLHHTFTESEIPSISLWAAVPSYVSSTASPKAALALLTRFATISPRPLLLDGLQSASHHYERDVSAAVADDEDLAEYVQRLEHLADVGEEAEDDPTPEWPHLADPFAAHAPHAGGEAAQDFVSEVEKYLRDQHD